MKVEGACENRFREIKVQNEFRVAERGLLKLQLEEAGTLRQYRPLLCVGGWVSSGVLLWVWNFRFYH